MMARVAFDARSADSGRLTGWERYTARLADGLQERAEVDVIRMNVATIQRRLTSDVTIGRRVSDYPVVHFPTFPPLAHRRGQKVILTVHDLTFWKYPETSSFLGRRYYRPLLRRAIARADHIVTHSEAVAHEVCEHFGVDSMRVTPIFCGADSFDGVEASPDRRTRPYVLSVGTVEPRKNLHRLVAAYAASGLPAEFDLVLVGRVGWGQVPKGVEVLTSVSDEQLKRLYLDASVVVVPSLYEGFGLPVVEALAFGRPVACSDIPVLREVGQELPSYFDPLDETAIGEAIWKAIDAGDSQMSSDQVERFTWDSVVQRVVKVYERVISQ